jgi:hypothetical protein
MPDESSDAVGTTPVPQVTDEPLPERTYTESEFNRHMAGLRRAAEGREAELKARVADLESKATAVKPAKPKNGEAEQPPDVSWKPDLREFRMVDRSIPDGVKLTEYQQTILEDMFIRAHPEDIKGWTVETVKAMGWGHPSPESKTDEPSTPVASTSVTSDQGPTAATTSWEDKRSPLEWNKDDISRIYSEKGLHAGQKFVRERMEAFLKGVTVVPAKGR